MKRQWENEELIIAEAAVGHPDEPVREVVFPVASEKLLREVIKEYKAKSPVFRKQVHLIRRITGASPRSSTAMSIPLEHCG